jgi:hypothetical protein
VIGAGLDTRALRLAPEFPEVASLLRDKIRSLSSMRVQLIFSYMVRWPQGSAGFRHANWWVYRWLAWRAEPFQWTMAPQAPEPWLQGLEFELPRQVEPPFTTPLVEPHLCLRGENLVMCGEGRELHQCLTTRKGAIRTRHFMGIWGFIRPEPGFYRPVFRFEVHLDPRKFFF